MKSECFVIYYIFRPNLNEVMGWNGASIFHLMLKHVKSTFHCPRCSWNIASMCYKTLESSDSLEARDGTNELFSGSLTTPMFQLGFVHWERCATKLNMMHSLSLA